MDDLADVIPSARFLAEFPDGKVPITHTEHLFWADDNYCDAAQALEDTVRLYDEARRVFGKVDMTLVDSLLRDYHAEKAQLARNVTLTGGGRRTHAVGDGQRVPEILRALLRTGVRVGVLLSVVEPWELFELAQGAVSRMPRDELIRFDDAILSGESYAQVADRHRLPKVSGRNWSNLRGFDNETPLLEAAELIDLCGTAEAITRTMAKYPYTHMDRATILSRRKALHG